MTSRTVIHARYTEAKEIQMPNKSQVPNSKSLAFGTFLLVVVPAASYYQRMKRISLLLITLSLCSSPSAPSQDAATEERLNKISGHIEDLIAGQKEQRERLSALARELETVREQASRPSA